MAKSSIVTLGWKFGVPALLAVAVWSAFWMYLQGNPPFMLELQEQQGIARYGFPFTAIYSGVLQPLKWWFAWLVGVLPNVTLWLVSCIVIACGTEQLAAARG